MDLEVVKKFYNTISPEILSEYARLAGLGGNTPIDFQYFSKLLLGKNKVLEVGCGTGRLGRFFIEGHEYIGIDVQQVYLDEFSKYLLEKGFHPSEILFLCSFMDYEGKDFDAVLFPWSVICDFDKNQQKKVLEKAYKLLNDGGIVILDNPAIGAPYNAFSGYSPSFFYFDEWEMVFREIGFTHSKKLEYVTTTDRKREISILIK
ncbi:MAG: L-histidine N(alpha)-methyltransferase [Patescibacteria group bacterium]